MKEIYATNAEQVVWFGHCRVDQCDTRRIRYSMPGVRFAVRVSGATEIGARMFGGYGFFSVHLRERTDVPEDIWFATTVAPTTSHVDTVTLATSLDRRKTYDVIVTKKTEPELRSLITRFQPVIVESVFIDSGEFLPITQKDTFYPHGWIEVIGDSDACGFGVEGELTSTSNIFSMDPEKEDVGKAWGTLLSRLMGLGDSAITVAGSGKGITVNAPMCGAETIPDIWHRETAEESEEGESWMQPIESPRALVMMVGGNDFYNHEIPDRNTFVTKFADFIKCIRGLRGTQVPIFLFQCSANCCSSAGGPYSHPSDDPTVNTSCNTLCEFTEEVSRVVREVDNGIYFHKIDIRLSTESDYSIMMHWNEAGQLAIARDMLATVREFLES